MSVGQQGSSATVDNALTNLATGIRDMMSAATDLNTWINGQGNGVAYLGQLGYSTIPSSTNPGGVSDAQLASNMIAYFNTLSAIYFGNLQQGGTGGTGATTFNFNQELSQLWGGR